MDTNTPAPITLHDVIKPVLDTYRDALSAAEKTLALKRNSAVETRTAARQRLRLEARESEAYDESSIAKNALNDFFSIATASAGEVFSTKTAPARLASKRIEQVSLDYSRDSPHDDHKLKNIVYSLRTSAEKEMFQLAIEEFQKEFDVASSDLKKPMRAARANVHKRRDDLLASIKSDERWVETTFEQEMKKLQAAFSATIKKAMAQVFAFCQGASTSAQDLVVPYQTYLAAEQAAYKARYERHTEISNTYFTVESPKLPGWRGVPPDRVADHQKAEAEMEATYSQAIEKARTDYFAASQAIFDQKRSQN